MIKNLHLVIAAGVSYGTLLCLFVALMPTVLVPVVVAKTPIPQGAWIVDPTMVGIRMMHRDEAPLTSVHNVGDVLGKQIIRSLDVDTPITPRDWTIMHCIMRDPAARKRLMSIRVPGNATIGFMEPGCDINLCVKMADPANADATIFKPVLSNVQVVAVTREEGTVVLGVLVDPASAEKCAWFADQKQYPLIIARNWSMPWPFSLLR